MLTFFEIYAALLAIILPYYFWLKWEYRFHRTVSFDKNWQGKGIDTTPVSNRLQELRQDYTPEVTRQPSDSRRQSRLTDAREAIKQLSFFQKPVELPEKEHEDRHFVF